MMAVQLMLRGEVAGSWYPNLTSEKSSGPPVRSFNIMARNVNG